MHSPDCKISNKYIKIWTKPKYFLTQKNKSHFCANHTDIHDMSICICAQITGVCVHWCFYLHAFVMYCFFQSMWSSQGLGAGVTWDKSESEYERRRSRDGGWCGWLVLHRDTERERQTDSDGGRRHAPAYGALSLFQNAMPIEIHRFNTICCSEFSSLYPIKELSHTSTYTRK